MEKTEKRLKRWGAEFHFKEGIRGKHFCVMRLVAGGLGICIGLSLGNPAYSLLVDVACYFLPDFLLFRMNKEDNRKMQEDIRLLYHSLQIQIKAGVYAMDALSEGHHSVRSKRLKKALEELGGSLLVGTNAKECLVDFRDKFDNRQIDSLTIILEQALETGKAVELIGELALQAKDLEREDNKRRKQNLDRAVTFYQLGILFALLGVILYGCIMGILETSI